MKGSNIQLHITPKQQTSLYSPMMIPATPPAPSPSSVALPAAEIRVEIQAITTFTQGTRS